MGSPYQGRIKILGPSEIEELYGRPRFYPEERTYYFALTPEERDIAHRYRTPENRILFILRAGYFKAKTMFFSFALHEVPDDIRYILQQHFSLVSEIRWQAPILRQTRHAQQQKILALYGYRTCQEAERARLADQARQMVRVAAKPLYLFQTLMRYLEAQHIVVPGYSVLQDIVSRALAAERQRMTTLIDRTLDPVTRAALDALYVNREGVYAITALKHEPKDFSLKELKQEIARNHGLTGVYQTACEILSKLEISNDSIRYYAALVDYYTVQKLQQLPTGMVYLYLLCFIRYRYQKFHDNLIHALIFQVRKVIDAAKVATQEKILHTQADHQDNLRHLSRILHLFLDDSIADDVTFGDVTFGDVKRRAFAILDRDRVQ